jgi:hypothetical protein
LLRDRVEKLIFIIEMAIVRPGAVECLADGCIAVGGTEK